MGEKRWGLGKYFGRESSPYKGSAIEATRYSEKYFVTWDYLALVCAREVLIIAATRVEISEGVTVR